MASKYHCVKLHTGAPIRIKPSRCKVEDRYYTDAAIGAFFEVVGDEDIYMLTISTGYKNCEVRYREMVLSESYMQHIEWKESELIIGTACHSFGKICLVRLDKDIVRALQSNGRANKWKYVMDLYGTYCEVEIHSGKDLGRLMETAVQSVQKAGMRYGRIAGYSHSENFLLVRGTISQAGFSDDDDVGALVTSLTVDGRVTAYGIIVGRNEKNESQVYLLGPALKKISQEYFGGREIRVCSPQNDQLKSRSHHHKTICDQQRNVKERAVLQDASLDSAIQC